VATDRYFVTASHCGSMRNSTDYTQFRQWTGYIGNETGDPSAFTSSYTPACPTGRLCRLADAAIYTYASPSLSDQGHVAYAGASSISFSSLITVTGTQGPAVGYTVNMIGSTSGRRFASVIADCVDVYPINGWPNGEFLCQGKSGYLSQDGDSGAPVITLFVDGTAWATGIHWGNVTDPNTHVVYSYFSPIDGILGEFFYHLPGNPNFSPVAP
jgi:hypothetical protein